MFYFMFSSENSLNNFIKEELRTTECPEELCSRACFEGETVYKLMKLQLPVMYKKWSENVLTVFPCNAYDGLGFIIGRTIEELIKRIYRELLEHLEYAVKNYDIDFLALTKLPIEPSLQKAIYIYEDFNELTYAFYIRNYEEEFTKSLTLRSWYVKKLFFNLSLEQSVILNPYAPHVVKPPDRDSLSKACKRLSNILSNNDILCIMRCI